MALTARITLDAATLQEIARIASWEVALGQQMIAAQTQNMYDLEHLAQDWMWTHFKNPTGRMEEAFDFLVDGRQARLENTVPYSQRRNYGFSGRTDALGRFYPHDPGILWAENAAQLSIPYVEKNVRGAINRTITGVSVP